jgi:hypothetical protein
MQSEPCKRNIILPYMQNDAQNNRISNIAKIMRFDDGHVLHTPHGKTKRRASVRIVHARP